MRKYKGFLIYESNSEFVMAKKGIVIARCTTEKECLSTIDHAFMSAIVDHNSAAVEHTNLAEK